MLLLDDVTLFEAKTFVPSLSKHDTAARSHLGVVSDPTGGMCKVKNVSLLFCKTR